MDLCSISLFPRLQVYPLHSSVTLEEQNNVFLSPVPGYRKVGEQEPLLMRALGMLRPVLVT